MRRWLWIVLLLGARRRRSRRSAVYHFADRAPVEDAGDQRPIPLPHPADFHKMFYFVDVVVTPAGGSNTAPRRRRAPRARRQFDGRGTAIQLVHATTGVREISNEELVRGPAQVGPPQLPLQVLKAKPEGNPASSSPTRDGHKYIVKFDPPEFPGIETTTSFVVNRLFWSFGYNVPEDFTFYVQRADLQSAPEAATRFRDVDKV
jgi:hypothetical protein